MRPYLLLALLLPGCTAADYAGVQGLIEVKRQFSDTEASVLVAAPCAMTYGAWTRLLPAQRDGVAALCGGEQPRGFDDALADVLTLRQAGLLPE